MNLNVLVAVGLALIVGYVGYHYLIADPDVVNDSSGSASQFSGLGGGGDANSRNIVAKMAKNDKNVVVFYGSQTGTAEDLATKLAKELSSKFGLKTMVADPDEYDFEALDTFPEGNLAIFLMASYGEGEPTDNAQELFTFLSSSPEFSLGETQLPNFHFSVFGLGNSSYEKFNQVGKDILRVLEELGAQRVGPYSEGDDGKGTLEEDFLAWKEELFTALKEQRDLEEHEAVYEPSIAVTRVDLTTASPDVYLGEPNLKHLVAAKDGSEVKGPFNQSNPYLARVTQARELFRNTDRNCIHMELAVNGVKYNTGDHLALWTQNSEEEVERFLQALGITDKDDVIQIKILDTTSPVRVPSPTTYDAIVRYHLEINGPVSRQVLAAFAPFAPTEAAKAETNRLANDKVAFHEKVTNHCFNLARLLLSLSDGKPWSAVPFSFIVETVPHLQPRFYSISSSSSETPETVSITAVVERQVPAGSDHVVKGVATNNVLALSHMLAGQPDYSYNLSGPRGAYERNDEFRVPVHIRHSLFKLPAKSSVPIIMVGPGTGVAPFRGFVHERAFQASQGKEVGKALLFFGSRDDKQDYLYGDEWPKYSEFLKVYTAFSRIGAEKMYVQHRMLEHSKEINELLDQGANFYVCGDASRMARDVHATLLEIIAKERGVSNEEAEKVVRKLKSRNKYQEDVW